ncbi:MAG: hypothetical protein KAR13_23000, partial [Desulfobulbaceae bacterium]|nr:hypothetical protein [Desulfobulbaceae bacterium]
MKVYQGVFLSAVSLGLLIAGNAFASIIPGNLAIDFRDTVWQPDNNYSSHQVSYTFGNVTATAYGYDDNLKYYRLNQHDIDGLGVRTYKKRNNEQVNEIDEINKGEYLRVEIEGGMDLTGVWITNLFDYEGYGENFMEPEYGHLVLNGSTTINFSADNTGQYPSNTSGGGTNGELWVEFLGSPRVFYIDFYPGESGKDALPCNEYSVAGFTPVPLPST